MAAGATQNIVSAMEKRGVERLVVVSVPGIAVRVPRLANGPGTGSFKAFFGSASPSMKVTRADLADFMLKQLTDDSWIRQAPISSN